VKPGEVFIALRGTIHDGHDHLREACEHGAALVVVDRSASAEGTAVAPAPLIVVEDTLKALQSLASYWRRKHRLPVIAVVGSVGKTTTKDMITSILSTEGPCLKNPGNFNNHIGLPLSLLELADYHRYAVLEIGANYPGEIRHLASILDPAAAVLTRIGWAHLEGFKTLDQLVAEKSSVLEKLPETGWCAINADDPNQEGSGGKAACKVITYGIGTGDVSAEDITLAQGETSFVLVLPSARERIRLKASGMHFVENALAAAAAILPFQLPPEQVAGGLASWKPAEGRGELLSPLPGVHFIDDAYNANPLSVRAALENLARFSQEGITVAVLGEMKELGDFSEEGHIRVGSDTARMGIDYLVAVGPSAALIARGARESGMDSSRIRVCEDSEEAVLSLEPLLIEGVWVLFKGSRAAKMEQIMEPFRQSRARAGSGGF